VTSQVPEQIATDIPGYRREGVASDIAGKPPQEHVCGNETGEDRESHPHAGGYHGCPTQRVDQHLHAVLRADRADDSANHGGENEAMRNRAPLYVAGKKRNRVPGECAKIIHRGRLIFAPVRTLAPT
jgi:hypothetical protein